MSERAVPRQHLRGGGRPEIHSLTQLRARGHMHLLPTRARVDAQLFGDLPLVRQIERSCRRCPVALAHS